MLLEEAAGELSDGQVERYARHLILDEIGETGQLKLLAARVLVVGAGGLGAPLLLYLAAAGVGTIGIVDDDVVDLSNLQRQIIHGMDGLARSKVASAAATLAGINPEIRIDTYPVRLTEANIDPLIGDYDIIADGSDNFTTRYLVNDAVVRQGKILVSASVTRFEGQLSTFKARAGGPCYRCIFPEAPPADLVPRCVDAGVLGPAVGVMGSLQATEIIKELLGIGESLSGTLLMYDALATSFYRVRVPKDPDCPVCRKI